MTEKETRDLCKLIREKLNSMESKSADPREKELFGLGFNLLEAHLVNQARIADSLKSLVTYVKNL